MAWQLLGAVTAQYLYVAWGYWQQGRYGMTLAFVAYGVANAGFILDHFEITTGVLHGR